MSDWRDGPLPFFLLAIAIIAGASAGVGVAMLISPRIKSTLGWKLNNPGNIERGQPWAGLAPEQLHARYATFIAPEFGIRVIAYLMEKYANVYGLNTVRGIISRYAPVHENPTDAYMSNVARALGLTGPKVVDMPFDVNASMKALIKAIIGQEIGYGRNPYPDSVIDEGIALARNPARVAQVLANPSILPSASIQFA